MENQALFFTAPGQIEICPMPILPLQPGEVLVQTLISAISPGSESIIYQGLFPADLCLDENLSALQGDFQYPTQYGYAAVGKVIELGAGVEKAWIDRLVFAFQPHQSHFTSRVTELQVLPAGIKLEDAVFLPNMETALNLVMDGAPLIGENVGIFGQGVVGLLTTALLARFPLNSLITLDPILYRRQISHRTGATQSIKPDSPEANQVFSEMPKGGADLIFELSGSPIALNQAIQITGFSGRIVIGSWYGQKRATLDLGGRFHRSRLRLVNSQVSNLAPELSGRWDKARRFELAWDMIPKIQPRQFITHRLSLNQAGLAYQRLTEKPEETLQIVFVYD